MKIKLASAALAVVGMTALVAPATAGAATPPPPNGGHILNITIGTPTTCTPINLGILRITICL